jgi:hypothetical protein
MRNLCFLCFCICIIVVAVLQIEFKGPHGPHACDSKFSWGQIILRQLFSHILIIIVALDLIQNSKPLVLLNLLVSHIGFLLYIIVVLGFLVSHYDHHCCFSYEFKGTNVRDSTCMVISIIGTHFSHLHCPKCPYWVLIQRL